MSPTQGTAVWAHTQYQQQCPATVSERLRLGVSGHLKNTRKLDVSRGNIFGNFILKQFPLKLLLCENTNCDSGHYF